MRLWSERLREKSLQTKLTKLKWKPGIAQKVAALLLVPLAIQVVLFIILFALLDRTQALEHLEAEQSSLVEGLDTLMIDRANGWGSFVSQILFDTRNNTLTADAYRERFESDYARIKKLKTVNSAVMDTIDDLRKTSTEE
jgi:hypothetical protein